MIEALRVRELAEVAGLAFGAGTILLLLLSMLPATKTAASQLWPLLGSEAIILAMGILPWLLPTTGTLACILFAASRLGFESGSVHSLVLGRSVSIPCSVLLALAASVGWVIGTDAILWILSIMLAVSAAMLALFRGSRVISSLPHFVIFPLAPVMAFSHAAAQPQLIPILVLAFLLVEVFDSFSLLGGRLYGRTPIVPRLSPKKTWEGLATGSVALLGVSLLLAIALGLPTTVMLFCAVVVFITAIAGDLAGSLAKRRANVKDYPAVMTVQGGLLDIMDAWLLAGPVLAAFALMAR